MTRQEIPGRSQFDLRSLNQCDYKGRGTTPVSTILGHHRAAGRPSPVWSAVVDGFELCLCSSVKHSLHRLSNFRLSQRFELALLLFGQVEETGDKLPATLEAGSR